MDYPSYLISNYAVLDLFHDQFTLNLVLFVTIEDILKKYKFYWTRFLDAFLTSENRFSKFLYSTT